MKLTRKRFIGKNDRSLNKFKRSSVFSTLGPKPKLPLNQHKVSHIYWFAYFNPRLPGVRYRGLYPLVHLKNTTHITYDIVFPGYSPLKMLTFLRVYFQALLFSKKNSVIVIQKVYTRKLYATLLKLLVKYRKNTLYDIDDAEYLERSDRTIHYFMRNCKICMVGSEAIKKHCLTYNARVFVNTSPVIDHNNQKSNQNKIPVFGWIGCYGGGHKECLLNEVIPALLTIKQEIKFVLLGVTRKKDLQHLLQLFSPHTNIKLDIPMHINWYNEDGIYKKIMEMDFGFAPLQNQEMHISKSAFKLKQYFSCGVPVIGSPLGENGKFLKNHVNGYIAQTKEDYAAVLHKVLALTPEQYSDLSKNAYAEHSSFNLDLYNQTFLAEAQDLI